MSTLAADVGSLDFNVQVDTSGLATGEQFNSLIGAIANLTVERRVYLQSQASDLNIVRGDHYNGLDSPKLSWNSEKTYGVAKPVNLIVFDRKTFWNSLGNSLGITTKLN